MSQKSSVPQAAESVSQVLMSDMHACASGFEPQNRQVLG